MYIDLILSAEVMVKIQQLDYLNFIVVKEVVCLFLWTRQVVSQNDCQCCLF